MAIILSPDCMYKGLDIYKEVNKDLKLKHNIYFNDEDIINELYFIL